MKQLEQLVTEAAAGDKTAFEELYKQTCKQVHFTCLAFLKNEQDAADVSQEVYITVLKSIDTLKDKSRFERWLGKITVNKCKDFLKKKDPVPVDEETLAELAVEEGELLLPEEYVTNKAKRKVLMDMMRETLSDVLYQTVILFYFQEMSAAEIAELMECPVGTVTSRLCIARAKIKEALERYEKEKGEKLYSVALVPILAVIFAEEAMAMEPENVCVKVITAASQSTVTTQVTQTGGTLMLKSLKAKWIAGFLALAVVIGGIAAAVMLFGHSDGDADDWEESSVQEDDETEEGKLSSEEREDETSEQGNMPGGESNSASGSEGEAEQSSEDASGQTEVAAKVAAARDQVDRYFTALKTGDIETVLALTDSESTSYKKLEKIKDYEYAREFITVFFGRMVWTHTEENLERWTQVFTTENFKSDTTAIHMEYAIPYATLFETLYVCAYEERETIPEYLDYRTADENAEALALLKKVIDALPLVLGLNIQITVPDETGAFLFVLDDLFEPFELDELYTGGTYIIFYMNQKCNLTSDVLVGSSTEEYWQYHEEWLELQPLLENKDFVALGDWQADYTGEDERPDKEKLYGTYEGLTATQKAWVDHFLAEEMIYVHPEHTKLGYSGKNVRDGAFMLFYPNIDSYDPEISQWRIENDVMAVRVVYPFSMNPEKFSEFVGSYYSVIGYATKNIE